MLAFRRCRDLTEGTQKRTGLNGAMPPTGAYHTRGVWKQQLSASASSVFPDSWEILEADNWWHRGSREWGTAQFELTNKRQPSHRVPELYSGNFSACR